MRVSAPRRPQFLGPPSPFARDGAGATPVPFARPAEASPAPAPFLREARADPASIRPLVQHTPAPPPAPGPVADPIPPAPPPPPPPLESEPSDEGNRIGPVDLSYETFEEYVQDTGNWPLVLDEGYVKPVSIEFHTFRAIGDMFSVIYEKDGNKIYAFQEYGFMDGTVYTMEDTTYFTTKVLGDYTFHCSVDLIDGSTAGVGVVNGTAFFVIAEKGIDFKEMLKHLYILSPQ